MLEKNRKNKDLYIAGVLLLFSFIFIFFTSQCSPFFGYNEWCDPHIYFSMGKGAFNGQVLYRDIFDHKGPLIFFIFGIGYLISSSDLFGVYILESIVLFVSLLFAYKTAKLFVDSKLSFTISLLFALIFSHKSEMGGSADEFITPCLVVSFFYFVSYFRTNNKNLININKHLFIHGLMFSIAFFIKFSACAFWLPLFIAIIYDLFKDKEYKKLFKAALYAALGFLIITIPILIYFIANSAFSDFYWGYFEFNLLYTGSNSSLSLIFKNIASRLSHSVVFDYKFVLVIAWSLFITLFSKKYIPNIIYRISIFISFLLTYLLIVIGPYDLVYAYIILSVYSIIGFIALFDIIDRKVIKAINPKVCYILSFVLILSIGVFNKKLFNRDLDCILREDKCNPIQRDFAEIIKKEPDATVINLDLDIGILTYANVVPVHKYFFHPCIPTTAFPEIRNSQINLIKNKDPMFVVSPFLDFPYLQENYNLIKEYEPYYLFERK